MKHSLTALLLSSSLMVAGTAFAADSSADAESKIDYKKNGGYEATEKAEKTTPGGTAISAKKDVDVSVKDDGRVNSETTTEEKTDPKGLMNEKKKTTKVKHSDKKNGGYKDTTSTESHDAQGTDTSTKKTTDVDMDKNGNVNSTETTKTTTDPKGLLNATTTTHKVKKVNGQVTEEKTDQ